MSDYEQSAEEIKFDDYFKVDTNQEDDDEFEDSNKFSVHSQSASLKKSVPTNIASKQQPGGLGKQVTMGAQKNTFGVKKQQIEDDDDQGYDSFEEESKEIKIGGVAKMQTNKQDEFEDSQKYSEDNQEESAAFDNAFKYDKDEFKSEISESQENQPPLTQTQNNKNMFSIHQEKPQPVQSNPFKDKALIQTNNNIKPIVQQSKAAPQIQNAFKSSDTSKQIQFQMNDNVQTESEVGFDDDIDDHFSEEPIENDFDQSSNISTKLKNMQNQDVGATVNMASVVPNPKLLSTNLGQTNLKQQPEEIKKQKSIKQQPDIKEESIKHEEEDEESKLDFEVVEQAEDSMEEIHNQINAIPSRFSDAGLQDSQGDQKQASNQKIPNTKKKVDSKQAVNNSQSKPKPREQSQNRVRPQTAKPQATSNITNRGASKSKYQMPPRPKINNNNDLSEVLPADNEEEFKEGDEGNTMLRATKNLLQSKLKSQRVILRPESAKPKVGYDGKPNVIGKAQPSKKFQMIKKLKEEKERKNQMVVRNLKKAKVIQQKQKETKQQEEILKKTQQDPILDDDDDFFKEEVMGVGDQAVAPGMNDGLINDEFEDISMNNQSVRQSVKDLAQTKVNDKSKVSTNALPQTTTTQPAQQNQGALGMLSNIMAGGLKVTKPTPQSLAVKKQKEQQQNVTANSKINGLGQKMDERFAEILKQKKDKLVNKDVLGFMMEKNLRNQKEKKEALEQNVNKLAKDFTVGDQPKVPLDQINKGSDKVPEHAKLVIDDEKLAKELMDLKRRLKEINLENLKISNNIQTVEKKKREKDAIFDKLMQDKNLVSVNGALQMQNVSMSKTGLIYGIKMEDIPNFDSIEKEKVNPLEPVVKKIESKGITVEQAFNLFDEDGDEVLTISEIKMGLKNQGIELLDSEMQELVKQIDANSDGVLTLEEWVNTLTPKYDAQKEFRQIMQNVDIDDPLVLEERILDLRFRSQRLEKELEILRETSGNEQGFNYKDRLKRKMKNPVQKKFVEKILTLEGRLQEKLSTVLFEKVNLESKIKQNLMTKDVVHQDYYEVQRQKERMETEYSMRLQSIQDNLNIYDHKLNDLTQLNLILKSEREQVQTSIKRMQIKLASAGEMEAQLDRQLESILGRAIDGKDLEMMYELDMQTLRQLNSGSNQKFDRFVKHFKHVKEYLKNKKLKAVTRIQRMFRRHLQRKIQLENLKKKNQMKKLMEEEEDRYYQNQQKMQEAARTIWRYWKNYKSKQLTDFYLVSKLSHRKAFDKTIEVVYLPSIRKCFICKCQDALYCESCYIDYHARGHRKLHSYKRIRFGEKPFNEKEAEEEMNKRFSVKENQQPNIIKPQDSKIDQQKQEEKKTTATILIQEKPAIIQPKPENNNTTTIKTEVKPQSIQQQQQQLQTQTTKTVKSVKLSDEAFLKSIKQIQTDLMGELEFFLEPEDEGLIRLGFLEQTLRKNPEIFKYSPEDIDRLCQIANDKCFAQHLNDDAADINAAFDPQMSDYLSHVAKAQADKGFFTLFNTDHFMEQWTKLYNMISKNDQFKKEQFNKHVERGVFRSGEGSPADIAKRRREIEERERLEELLRDKGYSDDPQENQKLYSLHLQSLLQNSVRNDNVDLIPDNNLFMNMPFMSLQQVNSAELGGARSLQSDGSYQVSYLIEPYPTECKNDGQMIPIVQTYNLCRLSNGGSDYFRVDYNTYTVLSTNFTNEFECSQQDVTRNVCYCPQGYYDAQCDTPLYKKCFVNITDPPFYQGCKKEDSPYYLYSIPGFDPCFYLDFNQQQDIKFILTCRITDDVPFLNPQSENLGYQYRDVKNMSQPAPFNYIAQNPVTNLKITKASTAKVQIQIFDWKWLSQQAKFTAEVNDPEVLVGIKEGTVAVDFPSIMQSDDRKDSKYVAGGRVYFETNAVGPQVTSFTTKGFFDQANYVEPVAPKDYTLAIVLGVVIPVVVIAAGVGAYFYFCHKKKKSQKVMHVD